VADGTLALAGGGGLGAGGIFTGGITLGAGTRLVHQGPGSQTLAGPVAGDGAITVAGGRLVLAAANALASDVTLLTGATLVLAHADAVNAASSQGIALGSGTGTVIELAATDGPRPLLHASNGFSTTVVSGRPLGTVGEGLRHELAAGIGLSGGTLTARAAESVTSGTAEVVVPSLSLTAGAVGAITRLNPTTAVMTLGGAAAAVNAVPKTLELSGSSSGNVVTGTLADGVSAVSLVKSGPGAWTLAAASTFTGPTTVTGGTLRLAHAQALAASGSVAITGGRIALPTDAPLAVDLRTLVVDETAGMLDVGRGRVTIGSGITAAALRADLIAGRRGGAWDGPFGIASSAAAADTAAGASRSVGWLDHGDGSFTVGYAAAGDTNIDGFVDLLDAANFLAGGLFDTGFSADWWVGDFTYDGLVDILDAADFVSAGLFDAGGYVDSGTAAPPMAAVPEPGSAVAVTMAAVIAIASRRLSRRS